MNEPIRYELEPRSTLDNHPQFATTLAHGFDVLKCFTTTRSSLGNKEIADELGFSRPKVSRLMFTLMALGYLSRDPRTQKYSLGPALLSLGYPLLSNLTVRWMAEHDLVELARFASGPVSMGVRDRLNVVYVETVHDSAYSGAKPDIGSTRPILNTAIGRAVLYGHDKKERQRLFQLLEEEHPDDTKKYKEGVQEAFEQIARDGFCISYGDWQTNLTGIAAPVRYRVGDSCLAINVTLASADVEKAWIEKELGPQLMSIVYKLESRLGVV